MMQALSSLNRTLKIQPIKGSVKVLYSTLFEIDHDALWCKLKKNAKANTHSSLL